MNGIDIDKLYSSGFVQGEIKYTEWYPWHKYKEIANKLQGCMYTIVHSDKKPTKNPFQLRSIFWGIIFGVPNFFSLVFFLEALADPSLDSSVVFTLVSIGVVISSSLLGVFLFNEKLDKTNWVGILLCVCAIYIFSY